MLRHSTALLQTQIEGPETDDAQQITLAEDTSYLCAHVGTWGIQMRISRQESPTTYLDSLWYHWSYANNSQEAERVDLRCHEAEELCEPVFYFISWTVNS